MADRTRARSGVTTWRLPFGFILWRKTAGRQKHNYDPKAVRGFRYRWAVIRYREIRNRSVGKS